jgi:hypothetical protein
MLPAMQRHASLNSRSRCNLKKGKNNIAIPGIQNGRTPCRVTFVKRQCTAMSMYYFFDYFEDATPLAYRDDLDLPLLG